MAGNDNQLGLFDQGYGSIPPEDCYQDGNDRPSRKEILDELHNHGWHVVGEVNTRVKLEACHGGGWLVQVYAAVAGCEDYQFMGRVVMAAQGEDDPDDAPSYVRHVVALQAVDRVVGGRNGLKFGAVEGGISWHEGETVYSWQVLSRREHGGVALLCRGGGTGEAWELIPLV